MKDLPVQPIMIHICLRPYVSRGYVDVTFGILMSAFYLVVTLWRSILLIDLLFNVMGRYFKNYEIYIIPVITQGESIITLTTETRILSANYVY